MNAGDKGENQQKRTSIDILQTSRNNTLKNIVLENRIEECKQEILVLLKILKTL